MIRVALTGVGVLAPGLDGWAQTAAVLDGSGAWNASEVHRPDANLLQATERRRASETTRYAIHVARHALDAAGLPYAAVKTVLATVTGASEISHQICESLARAERDVSPTKFTNSVHNAPMGYWAIATQCRAASTALACFDGSFAAGLLEAAALVAAEGDPVLFISCDTPYCEPLRRRYPVSATLAIALALAPGETGGALAELSLSLTDAAAPAEIAAALSPVAAMAGNNPTGPGLALLRALATRAAAATTTLAYLRHRALRVETRAC